VSFSWAKLGAALRAIATATTPANTRLIRSLLS
jgi:hypothetical protein